MHTWLSCQRREGAGTLFVLSIFACIVVLATTARAQAPSGEAMLPGPRLFRDAAGIRLAGPDASRSMVRRRLTGVDLAPLGGTLGALPVADRLTLNLFPNVELVATLSRVERTPRGLTWVGTVDGEPLGRAFLTVVGGALTGTVALPGAYYSVETEGVDVLIAELNESQRRPGDDTERAGGEGRGVAGPLALVVPPDDPSTVDLLLVYTARARQERGLNRVLSLIDQAVAFTNESLRNGRLPHQVRVACLAEVAYDEARDSVVDLARLRTAGDGHLDEVQQRRTDCGADLVMLFVSAMEPQYCGRAQLSTPSGGLGVYGIVSLGCSGITTLAHEIGHTFGAHHDWYVTSEPGWTTASHGQVESGAGWLTVMAYYDRCVDEERPCSRIPYFSTPAQTYRGAPLGIAAGTSTTCRTGVLGSKGCDADNAGTLATVIPRIANLRYGRISGSQVDFPVRNETFDFRTRLDAKYRDGLRRGITSTFSDPEGSVVWTQEYLMYRVQGCSHEQAVTRIRIQMGQLGLPGVCGAPPVGEIAFPPRDQTYRFRLELEGIYRNELNRPAVQTYVDPEGDVVWIQEYLRYRLNGCGHEAAVTRVMNQVDGRGIEPVCR